MKFLLVVEKCENFVISWNKSLNSYLEKDRIYVYRKYNRNQNA